MLREVTTNLLSQLVVLTLSLLKLLLPESSEGLRGGQRLPAVLLSTVQLLLVLLRMVHCLRQDGREQHSTPDKTSPTIHETRVHSPTTAWEGRGGEGEGEGRGGGGET